MARGQGNIIASKLTLTYYIKPRAFVRYISIAVIIAFSAQVASAQKTIARQSLYWTRYYNILTLHPKWSWHNEIDNRRFWENNRQHHLIMHSRLHYKWRGNADAALGLTYSRQSPQDPHSDKSLVVPEFRPVQEVNIVTPLGERWAFHSRFRVDERFFRRNDGSQLLAGYDFNIRFRHRIQLVYNVYKPGAKRPLSLKIANELMVNAGKNIVYNHFDQNRIYIGAEHGLFKNISAEIGYLHWYQQRNAGNQFYSRDIVRCTLYHRMKAN